MQSILSNWGVDSDIEENALTESTLSGAYIYRGFPVVMRWDWAGGGAHFLLIRGYDHTPHNVYYIDPWEGAYHIGSYTYVLGGPAPAYDHEWTRSLYTKTDPRVVWGRVTHSNGAAFPSVTMSVSLYGIGVACDPTDSDGQYLTNWGLGSYTITPSKNGYTFTPSSASGSVPPSRNFNFTGSP